MKMRHKPVEMRPELVEMRPELVEMRPELVEGPSRQRFDRLSAHCGDHDHD